MCDTTRRSRQDAVVDPHHQIFDHPRAKFRFCVLQRHLAIQAKLRPLQPRPRRGLAREDRCRVFVRLRPS